MCEESQGIYNNGDADDRWETLIELYRKGTISLDAAVNAAGVTVEEFEEKEKAFIEARENSIKEKIRSCKNKEGIYDWGVEEGKASGRWEIVIRLYKSGFISTKDAADAVGTSVEQFEKEESNYILFPRKKKQTLYICKGIEGIWKDGFAEGMERTLTERYGKEIADLFAKEYSKGYSEGYVDIQWEVLINLYRKGIISLEEAADASNNSVESFEEKAFKYTV